MIALHYLALACDSLAVLPSATADGLGGMYAKNADRSSHEAQPISVHSRKSHAPSEMITLDTGLKLPQVAVTYGHAGSRPNWANVYGGYSEGINEFGVSIGNEMFPSHHLPTDHGRKPQTEFTDLDRLVLERSRTAAEAVGVLTSLISQYGQTCRTCPSAANYNSMFMVADTKEAYSVMAVGHEWGWKRFDDKATNGTGIWTISNYRFEGATHVSATARQTAIANKLWSPDSGEPFDFGKVYGSSRADPSRHVRSMGLLNRLASDHKLTKEDLILTLSDHACTRETPPDGPPHPTPHPGRSCTQIDELTDGSHGLTASAMVSDFSTDGKRRIAWHAVTNPSMSIFYPTIFHHEGLATAVPDWLGSSAPWWGVRYVTYTLCKADARKIAYVQETWKPIQQRFFRTAEALAEEVYSLDAATADHRLAAFMANVSATIRATLIHFNETLPNMPEDRSASPAHVAADPSRSWLSYALFEAGPGHTITQMNATVIVPAKPSAVGADPSFWYGLQTSKGDGALIQPILAWGQSYRADYGIFHEVFDWNDMHDSRSPEAYKVQPGDTLTQSVKYVASENAYDMYIASAKTGQSISWRYKLERRQRANESTAYIVVEHSPRRCDMFPPSNGITFSDIYIEVDGEPVANPAWVTKQESTACKSKAVVVDKTTVRLEWDADATDAEEAALEERIREAKSSPCTSEPGACEKPAAKYERIQKSQPGYQWGDNGGYCGSWAVQRAVLAKGAWISQQQVRDHTSPAPGAPPSHDNEILSPNIDEALHKLKVKKEGFDFVNSPTPQQPAYFEWLKKQLVANHTVVWMIMWDGQSYPAYNMKLPYGVHGHVEPVIGIQSNHPLSNATVHDDDHFVHFTDGGVDTVYKQVSTLAGDWSPGGRATCHHGSRYCIGPYSYGWAIQGFLDPREGVPLSLAVDPWKREPDYRQHEPPIELTGTVTAEGLTVGTRYAIYRWDSVDEAFTYRPKYKIKTFTADDDTFVFEDPTAFWNNGTTYYRCVPVW